MDPVPDDVKTFGDAYELYEKWRTTEISGDQWIQMHNEFQQFYLDHGKSDLALRLAVSLTETIGELYRDGKKPVMPDYFGREDL